MPSCKHVLNHMVHVGGFGMNEEINNRHRSVKIGNRKYRVLNSKRRIALNVYQRFSVVYHKNRWVIAFVEDESMGVTNVFKSCHTINRSEALRLIGFLSDYVNLVKPTEATTLNASNKVSANRIIKNTHILTGLAVSEGL